MPSYYMHTYAYRRVLPGYETCGFISAMYFFLSRRNSVLERIFCKVSVFVDEVPLSSLGWMMIYTYIPSIVA